MLQIASPADYDTLKGAYEHVVAACDRHNVRMPDKLPSAVVWNDAVLRWFVYGSEHVLIGFDSVADEEPHVDLVLPGTGGVVDHSLDGLTDALAGAFQTPHFQKHFAKLAKSGYPERHLFVPVHYTAFEFEVIDGLQRSSQLPPSPPPHRSELTHLWLVAQFGGIVWLWRAESGWSRHQLPA